MWTSLLLLCVLAIPMASSQREMKRKQCPDIMMRGFSSSYTRQIYRYMDKIFYTSRALKEKELQKTAEFKRKILLTEFRVMDANRNGLVDGRESVSLFNRFWSLKRCVPQFLKSCDADKDKRVSPKEWLDCFGFEKCKKSCPRNKIDRLLCVCLCKNTTIQGLVLSYRLGFPLRDVSVRLVSGDASVRNAAPALTRSVQTNSSGQYETYFGTCDGDYFMTISKNGYSSVRLNMAAIQDMWHTAIEMEEAELPSVVIHPRSRSQQRGESVTFKCQADGDMPLRIEWYYNGQRLHETTFGTYSTLFIPKVDNRAGSYKCRAVNQHGSEYSQAAELTVIEPTHDSCASTPIVSSVKLPPGCINPSTGNDVLNIGRCSNEQCVGRSSREVCQDEHCCCGPVEMEPVELTCMRVFGIKMMRVIKCGCGKCEQRETVVKGLVVGGPNENPGKHLNVFVNGKLLATTDQQGVFQIVVPQEAERLVITFKDRSKLYTDSTVVLPFQQGQTVFHKIKLNMEDPPVEFKTTQELTVPLGHARDGSAMVELEVPANSFMTPYGKPYRGRARLRVSFTDPRNESDILSAPGDFSTVDEQGYVQPLKSYGMIRMSFEDDNNRQLGLTNSVKVYIDEDKLLHAGDREKEPAPRLWWLDEKTGRWRDAGQIKPVDENDSIRSRRATGREFLVGEIEMDKLAVINIDVLWQRCYVRVETFVNRRKEPEPTGGVEIRVIGQDVEDQFYGYTSAVSGPNGVSCVPVWCNASGFIQAEKSHFELPEGQEQIKKISTPLVPDDSNLPTFPAETKASVRRGNEFHFTAFVSESTGPVFANDDLTKCKKSGYGMKAFRFFQKTEEETAAEHIDIRYPPGHRLSWYAGGDSPNNAIQKCFLKVNIKSSLEPTIMLESFTPDGKEKFGFSVTKVTKSKSTENRVKFGRRTYTTCLEYRCSEPGKSTVLHLTMISDTCYLFMLSPKLRDAQMKEVRENELQVEFTATEGKYGKDYGMYTGKYTLAENQCHAGSESGAADGALNFDGHAVLVYPGWECPHLEEFSTFVA